jgi:hypothetical protein
MSRHIFLIAGALVLASTIPASAGGIGFGITIGPGAFGPSFRSAPPPPREYRPRARSYREEPSRPPRPHRQNSDDDAKAAETTPRANESSSIAVLSVKPDQDQLGLHGENSSIAGGPRPAEPAPSATVTVQLENSSIAATPVSAATPTAIVAVQAQNPIEQAASSHPVLCSRYYPTAGRTVQGPCE